MNYLDSLFTEPGARLKQWARNMYRNMLIFSVIALVVCLLKLVAVIALEVITHPFALFVHCWPHSLFSFLL